MSVLFTLTACQPGDPPQSQTQVAARGLIDAAFSQDGHFAVLASLDHGGSGWDLQQTVRRFAWNHREGEFTVLRAVAASADGKRVVTVGERGLVVWDAVSGQSESFWQAPGKVLAIALNRTGSQAFLGLRDNRAVLMDLTLGRTVLEVPHSGEVHAVSMSQDAQVLMTGTDTSEAFLWGRQGELLHRLRHQNQVRNVAVSPDGTLAFSAALRDRGQIFSLENSQVLGEFPLRTYNITASRFTADGRTLLLGSFQGDVIEADARSGDIRRHWQSFGAEPFGRGSRAILDISPAPSGGFQSLSSSGLLQRYR